MTIAFNPQFAARIPVSTGHVRFGAASETDAPKDTPKSAEPDVTERLETGANRIREFIDLFSETLNMARRGIRDAINVVRNLPKWDQLLKDADTEGKNSPVQRLKSVLDVTMAEFRAGYAGTEEAGEDMANFALYSGVLKRFPGLAAMPENDLAQIVLEGALSSNPFRPAEESRAALDDLQDLSAAQIEDALGVPADVADVTRPDITNPDVTNGAGGVDSEA